MSDALVPAPSSALASTAMSATGLRGRQKAAVLLIALGAHNAAEVLKHLSEREVEALSLEMSALDEVRPEVGEQVLEELSERVLAYDAVGIGGIGYAREVLENVFGADRAAELIKVVVEAGEGR